MELNPLTAKRLGDARDSAITQLNRMLRRPEETDFPLPSSKYPRWLIMALAILLLIVGFGAWWYSLGKQVAVSDSIVLAASVTRIGHFWADTAVFVPALVSEFGVLLFSLASAIFGGGRKVLGLTAFRWLAGICALIAIVANVSHTAGHIVLQHSIIQWLLTVVMPGLVLGVGLVLENQIMSTITERANAKAAYQAALMEYARWQADPESHPQWGRVYMIAVFEQIKAANRAQADALILLTTTDPYQIYRIVQREIARSDWTALSPNPTPAPAIPPSLVP